MDCFPPSLLSGQFPGTTTTDPETPESRMPEEDFFECSQQQDPDFSEDMFPDYENSEDVGTHDCGHFPCSRLDGFHYLKTKPDSWNAKEFENRIKRAQWEVKTATVHFAAAWDQFRMTENTTVSQIYAYERKLKFMQDFVKHNCDIIDPRIIGPTSYLWNIYSQHYYPPHKQQEDMDILAWSKSRIREHIDSAGEYPDCWRGNKEHQRPGVVCHALSVLPDDRPSLFFAVMEAADTLVLTPDLPAKHLPDDDMRESVEAIWSKMEDWKAEPKPIPFRNPWRFSAAVLALIHSLDCATELSFNPRSMGWPIDDPHPDDIMSPDGTLYDVEHGESYCDITSMANHLYKYMLAQERKPTIYGLAMDYLVLLEINTDAMRIAVKVINFMLAFFGHGSEGYEGCRQGDVGIHWQCAEKRLWSAGTIYVARARNQEKELWPRNFVDLTGLTEEKVRDTAIRIHARTARIPKSIKKMEWQHRATRLLGVPMFAWCMVDLSEDQALRKHPELNYQDERSSGEVITGRYEIPRDNTLRMK
jgi:hypothetical protein